MGDIGCYWPGIVMALTMLICVWVGCCGRCVVKTMLIISGSLGILGMSIFATIPASNAGNDAAGHAARMDVELKGITKWRYNFVYIALANVPFYIVLAVFVTHLVLACSIARDFESR